MAEKSSFFTSLNGDRKYKATDFAEYFGTFIGNGVFPNPSSNLLVTASGDMTINLSAGFAWINGYMYHNTNNLTLTVGHSDSALNRIDSVVIRCDFINREIKAHIKEGVFATNPVPPNLKRDVDVYELSIADILVEAGAISIQQSKITDKRLNSEACGIVTQTVKSIDTTDLYNKLQAYIDERGQDVAGWVDTATSSWEIEFNTWFNTIKNILDGDVAGKLANRILELENKVNNLDLVASKVTMADGSTVEETVTKNKADILGNTDLANQALNKANEAFRRGDNVKTQLVDKLISEGLDVSTDNTFEELIGNIALGKKWASGSFTFDYNNSITNTKSFSINCDFVPTIFFVKLDNVYCAREVTRDALISNLFSTTIMEDSTYYIKLRVTDLSKTNFTINFEYNYANATNIREGLTWYAFE